MIPAVVEDTSLGESGEVRGSSHDAVARLRSTPTANAGHERRSDRLAPMAISPRIPTATAVNGGQ